MMLSFFLHHISKVLLQKTCESALLVLGVLKCGCFIALFESFGSKHILNFPLVFLLYTILETKSVGCAIFSMTCIFSIGSSSVRPVELPSHYGIKGNGQEDSAIKSAICLTPNSRFIFVSVNQFLFSCLYRLKVQVLSL